MIYSKRSMDEHRKQSLISAQINREPGVEMMLSRRFFLPIGLQQENLSLRVKEACHHQFLALLYMGLLFVGNNHILDLHTGYFTHFLLYILV